MTIAPKYLKPWVLVLVEMPDQECEQNHHWFVGELVSFPTPENTIMVRTIPGLAASAIELPISAIHSKQAGKTGWVVYGEVTLSFGPRFPSDMLRYDCAVPANFKLDENNRVLLEEGFTKPIVATFVTGKSMPGFTKGRWASFGTSITELRRDRFGGNHG